LSKRKALKEISDDGGVLRGVKAKDATANVRTDANP